jgi:hypothetical protein
MSELPLFDIVATDEKSVRYHYVCPVKGKPMPGGVFKLPPSAKVEIGKVTMHCQLCGKQHTFTLKDLTAADS